MLGLHNFKQLKMNSLSIISIFLIFSCTINEANALTKNSLIEKEQKGNIFFNDSITINNIKYIKRVPYIENCNDIIFWSLVKQKGNIPELIKKLTDETVLTGVYVPNFGGEYTVADVSLVILNEKIKDIPIFELIEREVNEDCGYCSYWLFVRESNENRLQLQNTLKKWYEINKSKLIWVNSNYSLTGDCNSPVKGHYEVKKENATNKKTDE